MLKVDLPEGGSLSQVVELDLGVLKREEGVATMPVAWHATARRRPMPVFRGVLELRPLSASDDTAIVLDGVYRPPLRALGAFGDGLIGHRLARTSLKRFLDEVAQRLDAEVDHRKASGGYHPAPAPERLGLPGIL